MEPAKKKPGLAIVLGVGKPKKGMADEEPMDEEEGGEEKLGDATAEADAMDEFIAAVTSQDSGKALEAFKVLKSLCSDEE